MPRKKIPADMRSLTRGHTIKTLAGVASQEAAPAAARVSAAATPLDRGWGRAPHALVGEGDGPLCVVIRQITERGANQ